MPYYSVIFMDKEAANVQKVNRGLAPMKYPFNFPILFTVKSPDFKILGFPQ